MAGHQDHALDSLTPYDAQLVANLQQSKGILLGPYKALINWWSNAHTSAQKTPDALIGSATNPRQLVAYLKLTNKTPLEALPLLQGNMRNLALEIL